MNRSPYQGSCKHADSFSHRRRGSIFHYYMMYMLLTSILLTTSGMCIHTILKADHVDSKMSTQVQSVLRVENQLRRDIAQTRQARSNDQAVSLRRTQDRPDVRWSVDQNVVIRETLGDDTTATTNRFVFNRGTQPTIRVQGRRVTLTIQEPPYTKKQQKNDKSPSIAPRVEIVAIASRKAEDEDSLANVAAGVPPSNPDTDSHDFAIMGDAS